MTIRMTKKVAIIIVAAGNGSRIAGDVPKQWRFLADLPLVVHSFRFFDQLEVVTQLTIVLDVDSLQHQERCNWLQSENDKPIKLVTGGVSRQHSVWNAMRDLEEYKPDIVSIHDAARPFPASVELFRDSIKQAHTSGGCILSVPVVDTIKQADNQMMITSEPKRSMLWAAQTPQTFQYTALLDAYKQQESQLSSFTDDASVFQASGGQVRILQSLSSNFKITNSDDFLRAEHFLKNK